MGWTSPEISLYDRFVDRAEVTTAENQYPVKHL